MIGTWSCLFLLPNNPYDAAFLAVLLFDALAFVACLIASRGKSTNVVPEAVRVMGAVELTLLVAQIIDFTLTIAFYLPFFSFC